MAPPDTTNAVHALRPASSAAAPADAGSSPMGDLHAAWLSWIEGLLRTNEMPLSGNVSQWIRTWGEAVGQVGLLNINLSGSGNPQLEKDISAQFSYGRQLGRMLDMLAPLVAANRTLLEDKAGATAVADFERMVEGIQRLKHPQAAVDVPDIVEKVKLWRGSPTFQQDLGQLLQQLQALAATQ